MASGTEVVAGGSPRRKTLKIALVALVLALTAAAQTADEQLARAKQVGAAKDWPATERLLRAGFEAYPRDARFPAELAGVYFAQKNYSESKRWVHRALAVSPRDEYANQLAGTLYLQDGNLEAALKFWNRAGWPKIDAITADPDSSDVDRHLINASIKNSSAEGVLLREDLLETERRLRHLNLFSTVRSELLPGSRDNFELRIRARDHARWGKNTKVAALRLLRGLPGMSVYPEFYDIGGSGTSVVSRVRFDPRRLRVAADVTYPWKRDPAWVLGLTFDGREEEWELREAQSRAPLTGFTMRTLRAGPTISKVLNSRCEWFTALEWTRTEFREGAQPTVAGSGAQNRHEASCDLLRVPERRFVFRGDTRVTLARLWDDGRSRFVQVQPNLALEWFPQPAGDDYRTQIALRGGATAGDVPLNHLFVLGTDRDDALPLRAHRALDDRRKGSAPLARSFLLANIEADKNLYRRGFFGIAAGPFLDVAQVWEAANTRDTWFADAGLQLKLRVMGEFGVSFGYGWDLREGRGAFSVRSGR